MTPSLTWKQILALGPCEDERNHVRAALKAKFPDYRTRALTMADAAEAGVDFTNLLWIASEASRADPDVARRLHLFAADCAARVSHLAPDPRSRGAIVAARRFARGEIGTDELADVSDAARAAAGAAAGAAASDAASDAAWAAAWAAARAAAGAAKAAGDAARSWQLTRLIAWFSDNETEDWPIAEPEKEAA